MKQLAADGIDNGYCNSMKWVFAREVADRVLFMDGGYIVEVRYSTGSTSEFQK